MAPPRRSPANGNGGAGTDIHAAKLNGSINRPQTKTQELVAELHPPERKSGVKFTGLYSVSFLGEMIVENSKVAELDAAGVLLSRGFTGKLTFLDSTTSRPRLVINIEKAAKLTAEEGPSGPRFVKWRERRVDRSPAAGKRLAGIAAPDWRLRRNSVRPETPMASCKGARR
jgi:hypothetical protein